MATPSGNSPSSSASSRGSGGKKKRKLEYTLSTSEQYLQLKYGFLNSHAPFCDICKSFICGSWDEHQRDYALDSSKLNLTKTQVEDMIIAHLDVIYKNVIEDLTSKYGYPEAAAASAVLATGICYGCKDPIGNSLKHSLIFLKCGLRVDNFERQNIPEELKKLVKFVAMIVFDEQKKKYPYLCKDDFLLWLLIYEMDHSGAPTLDSFPFASLGNLMVSSSSTSLQWKEESTLNSYTVQSMSGAGVAEDDKLDASSPHPQNASEHKLTPQTGIPGLASGRFAASTSLSLANSNPNTAKKNPISSSDSLLDQFSSLTISETSIAEDKLANANSKHADSSRRGFYHGRSERRCQAKLVGKAGKLVTMANQILGRSTMLDSNCSLPKLDKTVGLEWLQSFAAKNFSIDAGSFGTSSFSMNIVSTTSSLSHAANADTFTSIPSKSGSDASIPYVLKNLLSRDKDLRAQLQYWTNRAGHKVMQTTSRLNKDKAELQTLRKEKMEAKKEKEAFKDSTTRKIGEMDTALSWSRTQVEVASAAICKLEFDRIRLEQELEAAKLRASESAASSQEASLKEIVTLKKAQTCERERTLLQEELVTEKRVLSQLQPQLQRAQVSHGQLEVITSKFAVCLFCFSFFFWKILSGVLLFICLLV